ncbi:DUF2213 domain-containing protein [Enterobacteriaceae bacterium LUAb1]
MKDEKFAFDKASVRRYDADGMLHVELTPISKANVCVYYGEEIHGWEELGLDPKKGYRLLRDPKELENSVATFNNKPLLDRHIAVSVINPPKEAIIGSTGESSEFDGTYLKNSLVIWDVNSIIGVENKQQREISSSYRYRLDMTPGERDGELYDGVMRDIVCNHVAIVPSGRAGPDVFVYDSQPTGMRLMSKLKQIMSLFKPHLANDADPEEMEKKVGEIIEDDDKDGKIAKDEEKDKDEKDLAKDEENDAGKKDKKTAEDESDEGEKKKEDKIAMDSMRRRLRAELTQQFNNLRRAERECESLIGQVACDSAEEVYRMALRQGGIKYVDSLPVEALRPMVSMLKDKGMAQDSIPTFTVDQRSKVKSFFEGN